VAVYPDDGLDAEILLDRADMAMYRAKEAGRNGIEFFTPGMDSLGDERLSLEYALRGALERDELVVYYQPLVRPTGIWWAPRRWCAGATRSWGCCCPGASSRWPRRAA